MAKIETYEVARIIARKVWVDSWLFTVSNQPGQKYCRCGIACAAIVKTDEVRVMYSVLRKVRSGMPDHVSTLSAGLATRSSCRETLYRPAEPQSWAVYFKNACMTGCKMPWWIYSSLPRFAGRLHTLKMCERSLFLARQPSPLGGGLARH